MAVAAGATASFTASASGLPTPTVQWQVSTNNGLTWSNINGATATTYSFTAASSQSGYDYRAVFTNSLGSATTAAARLSITPSPATMKPAMVQASTVTGTAITNLDNATLAALRAAAIDAVMARLL